MLQLGTLDRQYKAKLKRQREDVEKARKMKAAEKKEERRKLGLAERDQELFARQPMKEKLKAQKGSVRGQHQLPSKLKCSSQKVKTVFHFTVLNEQYK